MTGALSILRGRDEIRTTIEPAVCPNYPATKGRFMNRPYDIRINLLNATTALSSA